MRFLLIYILFPFVSFAQNQEEMVVYTFGQVDPQFPGGDRAMQAFIDSNLVYEPQALYEMQSVVYIQFNVGIDGALSEIVIARSATAEMDKAACDVVSKMPNWIPGVGRDGKPAVVSMTLPIKFRMK